MIPYQQDISSLLSVQREIDVDSAIAVVPLVQVGNSQEIPFTSDKKLFKAQDLLLKSMENEQCEQEMIPRILQILLGQDTFIYDHDASDQVKCGEFVENVHHRNLITYALQAENALTSLKIHLAELVSLKNLRGVSNKRRDKHTCARLAVASFCKLGVCYLVILDKLNGDKKSLPLEAESRSQHLYGKNRLKRAKNTLKDAEERYKQILREKNLTPQDIEMELLDFASKPKFLAGFADFFKVTEYSALRIKVNHFVELLRQKVGITSAFDLDDEKQATSASLPRVQIAEIPSELEFKESRQPAPLSFWRAFTKVKSKDEHKQKFFEFMLTDWSVDYFYDIYLTNELVKSRSIINPDFKKECLILLKKCLQKNLFNHAAGIIMHALRVKGKQSKLEQASKNKLTKQEISLVQYEQNNSLYQLKKLIGEDYSENLLKYYEMKARIESSAGLSVQERDELIAIKKNLRQAALKKRKKIDLTPRFTFPYLNQVLHLMRENPDFVDYEIIKLAAFYAKKEREQLIDTTGQSVGVPVKRSHISKQTFDEPPAKIRANQLNESFSAFEQQQALSRLAQTVSLPEQLAESPSFASYSQFVAPQRIEFTDENKIGRMTKEEIDREKELIPILDEAAPAERALLKQLREIQLAMEIAPSSSQEANISDTHSSSLCFATTAEQNDDVQ